MVMGSQSLIRQDKGCRPPAFTGRWKVEGQAASPARTTRRLSAEMTYALVFVIALCGIIRIFYAFGKSEFTVRQGRYTRRLCGFRRVAGVELIVFTL